MQNEKPRRPRKTFDDQPQSGERKKTFKKSFDDKPYGSDKRSSSRRSSDDKPYSGDRKSSFKKSFDDKPFGSDKRSSSRKSSDDKPYSGDRKSSFKKSFDDKPYGSDKRSSSRKSSDDKPYSGDRKSSFKKSFDDKPYGSDKKYSGNSSFGDKKEGYRKKSFDDASEGKRKYSDSNERKQGDGFKKSFSDDRDKRQSFKPRFDDGDNRKDFKKKSFDERDNKKKSFGDRDTSFSGNDDLFGKFGKRPSKTEQRPDRDERKKPKSEFKEEGFDKKPKKKEDAFDDSFSWDEEFTPGMLEWLDDEPREDKKKKSKERDTAPKGDRDDRKKRDDWTADKPSFSDRSHRDDKPKFKDRSFKEYKPKKAAKEVVEHDYIRLNKYLSNAGISSRREADDLIKTGVVTVNGKVVTEMGYRVMPGDKVVYGGQAIKPEKPVYLLLNKPKDYITTSEDPHNRKTVMHLVDKACKERVYPVGRLDRNTTGLLLFTNDGEMAKKLMHPSSMVRKIYHVVLDKALAKADLDKIREGIALEDGYMKVDEINYVEGVENKKEVGVTIHSGKNRVVRRIFEALGYEVVKLDRVYFAGLTKKDLPRGRYRFLDKMELNMLKMI
jgi:23S rRNA pseudouridine2605 synthase